MDLVMVSDMADHLENHEDPDQWARLILYPAENKEANVGCRLPQISCHGQHFMIPMSFCCQRLRCCGPMPTFGLSLCPSSSGYSRPQCILCTDVIHCIRFHYDGWHSNKAISSLNTVFIRPLQEKHSVKCTRKIRCQCCKFSRGMQFRVPHSMKMQEKMTPRNTHDGQSAHNQVMIMKLEKWSQPVNKS